MIRLLTYVTRRFIRAFLIAVPLWIIMWPTFALISVITPKGYGLDVLVGILFYGELLPWYWPVGIEYVDRKFPNLHKPWEDVP